MCRNAGGNRYVPSMQSHVTFLDSFNGKCAQRSEVLTKTDCDNDLGKLLRIREAKQAEIVLVKRIRLKHAALRADRHWYFNRSTEDELVHVWPTLALNYLIMSQWLVAIRRVLSCIHVRSALNRTPVLASSDSYCVHAV